MHTIRKATLEDFPSVASLHQEIADMHVTGAGWNFEQIIPSYTRELFRECLEDKETFFLLAIDGSHVCGFAVYQVKHSEDYPILRKRSWLFLKDIIVTEKMKGRGVGTLLLQEGERIAKESSLDSIELSVWSFNEEAIEFYKKKGFEPFSIKMRKEI